MLTKQVYTIGNCLDVMLQMPSDSVDLIMTSPPYGDARKRTYGGIHPDNYIEWFKPIARQIYRIMKPSGSFILNIGDNTIDGETHLYTYEIPIVLKRELGFKFIDPFVWHKKNCPPGKYKNRFKGAWEFCYHFSKTLDITYNPCAVAEPMKQCSIDRALRHHEGNLEIFSTGSGFTTAHAKIKETIRRNRKNGSGFGTNDERLNSLEMALPSNVLFLPTETTNVAHSAPFPIELPTFFIKAFSNEGDMVLDPFAGSGTTLRACRLLNRNCMGIDLNSEYESIANERSMANTPHLETWCSGQDVA